MVMATASDDDHQDLSEEELGLFNVDMVNGTSPPISVTMLINGKPVKMMVDTGAAVTQLSQDIFDTLDNVAFEEADLNLATYTSETISLLGKSKVEVQYGNKKFHVEVYVTEGSRACEIG